MKKHIAQFKILILAITIGLGANYALATVWTGPSVSAPGNNKPTILNTTISDQSKGGTVVPGSLLNVKGILSGQDVAVWNNANVVNSVTINTLAGDNHLCVNNLHKLIVCPATVPTGPVCGNGLVESGEQCDDGGTLSGDGCSSTCQNESPIGGACNYFPGIAVLCQAGEICANDLAHSGFETCQ